MDRPTERPIKLLVAAKMNELPIPSNFHVSYSISLSCFNINVSEWGLKIQSEIYLSIHVGQRDNLC